MAESILILTVTIALGLLLGRVKIKGVSLGVTWVLFVGIILSHFGLTADATTLAFVKNFGLILFVFAIGLQVGPGFFHSFRKGGLNMNLLAVMMILMGVGTTYAIHFVSGESIETMVGVMSGAVTNTPGLGAAQETLQNSLVSGGTPVPEAVSRSASLASSYAVAYPMGVLGVIAVIIAFKALFRVDLEKERKVIKEADDTARESARRMHVQVENPAIFGKTLREVVSAEKLRFVIGRIMKKGEISIMNHDTILEQGDILLIVTSQSEVDRIRELFGKEVPMHQSDWDAMDKVYTSKRLSITRSSLTGDTLGKLHIREAFNVTVTRVVRSGVELVASPGLILQMGDSIQVVGTQEDIDHLARFVGNKPEKLTHPNLVPIFFGIALGVLLGILPIRFPGIPQPVKLGLAGGPLIVAILLGHFGGKMHITTYTTMSANLMLREIGIDLFMAAVGLGAGGNFVASLTAGGWWWILYGALITMVPVSLTMLVAKVFFRYSFYQICGLVCGACNNAPVLAFCQGAYGTDYTAVNYATVYPLSMFLRVLAAQMMILFAFA